MGEVSEATPKSSPQVWIQPFDVVQRWSLAGRQARVRLGDDNSLSQSNETSGLLRGIRSRLVIDTGVSELCGKKIRINS